jgi:hypothetical protein
MLTVGAVVSITTVRLVDAVDWFPAKSVLVAVIVHVPSESPDNEHDAPDVFDATLH